MSGSSGNGNGTMSYTVVPNPNTTSRTGTMTIAGQTFTVNQEACNYSISPTSQSFSSDGGMGGVSITAPGGCTWTAASNAADWIHITSGNSGSGNGSVVYTVDENSNPTSRTGTLTIAGKTFTVNQAALTCNYSISPASQSFFADGGMGSVGVTVSSGCAWAASSQASWIRITAGNSGNGNGTVSYTVDSNSTTTTRTGTLTIAGKAITVTQSGCTYSIAPTSYTHGPNTETGSVSIFTQSGCNWTATSNASWLQVTSGSSGSGLGSVFYTIQQNLDSTPRTGTLTIAQQTYTVTQQLNPPVSYTLSISADAGGTTVPAPNTYSYTAGTVISINAQAQNGYFFSGWGGDASGTTNPLNVTMNDNKTIVAHFMPQSSDQYSLTITASAGGTTNPAPGTHAYTKNSPVTLTAIPTDGYVFTGWSGDASGTTSPLTITMNGNKSVTASFGQAGGKSFNYTITATAKETCQQPQGVTATKSGTAIETWFRTETIPVGLSSLPGKSSFYISDIWNAQNFKVKVTIYSGDGTATVTIYDSYGQQVIGSVASSKPCSGYGYCEKIQNVGLTSGKWYQSEFTLSNNSVYATVDLLGDVKNTGTIRSTVCNLSGQVTKGEAPKDIGWCAVTFQPFYGGTLSNKSYSVSSNSSVGVKFADTNSTTTTSDTAHVVAQAVNDFTKDFPRSESRSGTGTVTTGMLFTLPYTFSFTPQCGGTLSQFTATVQDDQDGILTTLTQTVNGNTIQGNLTGTLIGYPTVSRATLNFGNVEFSTSSAPQIITITNTGYADLKISSLTVNLAEFAIQNNQCSNQTLHPEGGSCTVEMVWTPTSPGAKNGTLTITTDSLDNNGKTRKISLTGVSVITPPSISDIPDQTINENESTGEIAFTIDNPNKPIANLIVAATSDNQTLVPDGNVTLGGTDTNRTIRITPAANQFGTTKITVTVTDGSRSLTVSDTFLLTVTMKPNLKRGLRAYYPFEGTVEDVSGNTQHGTNVGVTYSQGIIGQAAIFNGTTAYVKIGDPVPAALQIQNEISLSAWIYVTEYPATNTLNLIVGSQYDPTASGMSIFLDGRTNSDGQTSPAGHIHFQIGNGSWHVTNANSQVPLNQWVHIVATRKANEPGKIYYNGELQPSTSVAWSGSVTYTSSEMAIGRQKGFSNRYFKGKIDDVRVYDRAIMREEVALLYDQRFSPSIALTEPNGSDDMASQTYRIEWTDEIPDGDASITLFYDSDNQGQNGTRITDCDPITENDETDSCTWNTSQIPEGSYYIYAKITDGVNPEVVDYSDGAVTIIHNGYIAISGSSHSLALKSDGTVWAWGNNGSGQLGDRTKISRNAPVRVTGINNITAISAGGGHSLALKSDGTVWAWGDNWSYGQLGDGTNISRDTPVQVIGINNIIAISAGRLHSLALKNDGTVWAWGYNGNGQLGDGTGISRNTPVQVPGMNNITAISRGDMHSLALRKDGTVWAWGYNGSGQLGDGTTITRNTPIRVAGINNMIAISGGGNHSLALKNDGTLWAWGNNWYGQIGDGTNTHRNTPIQVTGINNITAISLGYDHSFALKNDGTLWAWGINQYGQLGDGTNAYRKTPVQVTGINNVTAISLGWHHSLALKNNGTAWAWGYNQYEQLGDGTNTNRNTPVQVLPGKDYRPTIQVIEPNGRNDSADQNYPIEWTDDDPDSNAAIGIYYDTDNQGQNGTRITDCDPITEDDDTNSCTWNTSGVPEGDYFIYACIDDGTPPLLCDYSDGTVTIDHTTFPRFEAKLLANDAGAGDAFGVSVAVAGDNAIIGAANYSGQGHYSGSAYIFHRNATGAWTQQTKLLASVFTEGDGFGQSVSISGDYAIVGASQDDDSGPNSGAAHIFHREETGIWTQQAKLLADDGASGDYFGETVSISGDYAIVGARSDDDRGSNTGAAYIFRREGTTWIQQAKLLGNDSMMEDAFGSAVSISGDYVIIGAAYDDYTGYNNGSAYIFHRDAAGLWQQQAKLLANDGAPYDLFGRSVSISGDYAIVGVSPDNKNTGAAYIFRREGTAWTQQAKLLSSDGNPKDRFGYPVSLSGDRVIVGASQDQDNGMYSGSAYLFIRQGTAWIKSMKLLACDGALADSFGRSVSVSGNIGIIGAAGGDDYGTDSGSVYIYNLANISPSIQLHEPNGQDDIADNAYIITWTDDDPDNNALISLYYDTNNTGADGTRIPNCDPITEDDETDSCTWNTSAIAAGTYYVYAVINDNVNEPVIAYSNGTVTIQHTPQPVPADTNGDGTVDLSDVSLVVFDIIGTGDCDACDVNRDGVENIFDVMAVILAITNP